MNRLIDIDFLINLGFVIIKLKKPSAREILSHKFLNFQKRKFLTF